MSKNNLGTDEKVPLIATAQRTSGVPCVESGFAGVPETDAATGTLFSQRLTGRVAFPTVSGVAKGGIVFITATTGALSNATGTGKRRFARVYAVGGTDPGPQAGTSWGVLLPDTDNAA